MQVLLSQLFDKFKSALRNPACPGCQKPIPAASGQNDVFCETCLSRYSFRETFPLLQTQNTATYAATLFNPTVKRLIYGYKFYQQPEHESLLVALLTAYWTNVLSNAPADLRADASPSQAQQVLVVPVPAHEAHRDHMNAIAEQFAWHFGYRFEPNLLVWARTVPPQHTMTGRKRRFANVQDSMAVSYCRNPKPLLSTRRVIVLDDIHTTGATLQEATQAFQRCPIYDGAVTSLTLTHLALSFQRHLS